MKLSRTVDYALRATMLLAQEQPNKPVPCSHIAREGDMPERFLLQILRNLVNQGLLRSTRGVDGGYTLAKPAADVSLLTIIEAIEGPLDETGPIGDPEALPDTTQRLEAALKNVSATMRRQLDSIKIAHLIRPPQEQPTTR